MGYLEARLRLCGVLLEEDGEVVQLVGDGLGGDEGGLGLRLRRSVFIF